MCCTALSYIIIHYTTRYYTILYYTILYYTILYYTIPYNTIQHSHYQMLCCTALYCNISHSHTISYVILDCSVIYWQIKRSLLNPNNIHSINIWESCFWFSTSWNKQTIVIFGKNIVRKTPTSLTSTFSFWISKYSELLLNKFQNSNTKVIPYTMMHTLILHTHVSDQ